MKARSRAQDRNLKTVTEMEPQWCAAYQLAFRAYSVCFVYSPEPPAQE